MECSHQIMSPDFLSEIQPAGIKDGKDSIPDEH